LAENGWTETHSFGFGPDLVGDGVGVEVGLWLGDGLVEVGVPVGVGVGVLPLLPGVGLPVEVVLGSGETDGDDGDELGSVLGEVAPALGDALGSVVELGSADELGLPVLNVTSATAETESSDSWLPARSARWAAAVAGRVEHALVTIAGWVVRVAATASPNSPLLMSTTPATVPNVAILTRRCFTG
jgi:hypothetical protein